MKDISCIDVYGEIHECFIGLDVRYIDVYILLNIF